MNLNNTLPSRKSMRSTSNARLACAGRIGKTLVSQSNQSIASNSIHKKSIIRLAEFGVPVSSPTTPPPSPPPAPPSDSASLALPSSVSRSPHPPCSSFVSFHSPPVAWRRARVSRSRQSRPPPLSPSPSPSPSSSPSYRTDRRKNSHRRTIARRHPSARETARRRRRRRCHPRARARSSSSSSSSGTLDDEERETDARERARGPCARSRAMGTPSRARRPLARREMTDDCDEISTRG